MIPLKSDIATADEADWSFAENDELMSALGLMVARESRSFGLSADDVLQEVYLWLAVRPRLAGQDVPLAVNAARQRVAQLRETAVYRREHETTLEEDA